MAVLVYTESENGTFKKMAFEVASYAKALADQTGTTVTALAVNANNAGELGKYGVDKVLSVTDEKLDNFNASAYAGILGTGRSKGRCRDCCAKFQRQCQIPGFHAGGKASGRLCF